MNEKVAKLRVVADERMPKGVAALVDANGKLHAIVNIDQARVEPEWPTRWSDPTYLGDGPWGA